MRVGEAKRLEISEVHMSGAPEKRAPRRELYLKGSGECDKYPQRGLEMTRVEEPCALCFQGRGCSKAKCRIKQTTNCQSEPMGLGLLCRASRSPDKCRSGSWNVLTLQEQAGPGRLRDRD